MKYKFQTFLPLLVIYAAIHTVTADPFVSQADSLTIAQQLSSIFGISYDVHQIVNVDSVKQNIKYCRGAIEDPYETLSNCLIFSAHRKVSSYRYGYSVVGVFKNNQIVWHSDDLIKPSCFSFGQIFTTRDLLFNGKVEIVTKWVDCNTGVGGHCLWIFSWDGYTGTLINDIDISGSSVIRTDQYSDFGFVDIEGDGIWEIEASGYTINDEGEIEPLPFYYSWNGELYGEWTNTPEYDPEFFPPRDKVDVQFKVQVTRIDSFNLKFHYIIKNETSSIQKINEIIMAKKDVNFERISIRDGWRFINHSNELILFDENQPPISYTTKYQIRQGETDSSFTFSFTALPSINKFYVRGFNEEREKVDAVEDYQNIFVNSQIGCTLGPASFPDTVNLLNFLDTLIYDNQMSDSIGWITNPSTTTKYNDYFDNTKFYLQQNNNPAAINVLDSVLTDVKADSGVTLTSEAYALIKYNTEYLKDQLTQPHGLPHNVQLLNRQGQLLTGGSLQYYDGGWKAAVNNGDGTFLVETERSTVSLRMSYEGGNETRQNVPIQGAVVTFKTVNSKVELHDSQNQLIDQGTVQYYAGGWRDFGVTTGGIASKELLPLQYSFRMTYAYASIDKQQNIGQDSVVVFQTVAARAELRNSGGNLIDQGTVQYYAGAWREFGTTSGGIVTKELLPKQYSFRMSYAYASIDKQQDIGSDPVVSFATVLAAINVTGQQNQPLNGALVSYYAGAWRSIGETVNGSIARELLPRNYTFRAAYQGTSADLQQDISRNSTVNIQLNVTGP
jgi:hypothetical protein